MTRQVRAAEVVPSLWTPLRVAAFRALWFARLGSMLGTWMQAVGAQWLLVVVPDLTALVALVPVAAMLPVLGQHPCQCRATDGGRAGHRSRTVPRCAAPCGHLSARSGSVGAGSRRDALVTGVPRS